MGLQIEKIKDMEYTPLPDVMKKLEGHFEEIKVEKSEEKMVAVS